MNGVDASVNSAWDRACLALQLLCIDPVGLGGMTVRARAGPVRDAFIESLDRLPLAPLRLTPQISDDMLFGGIDLGQTLSLGRLVRTSGLVNRKATLVLPMAERCQPHLAARLASLLDLGGRALILLDEGSEPDDRPPRVLTERLAFHVDLTAVAFAETRHGDAPYLPRARDRAATGSAARTLTEIAALFGIGSFRAPTLALRVARAHAAFKGRGIISDDDIRIAAELVYPSRATQVPVSDEQTGRDAEAAPDGPGNSPESGAALPETLVDAVHALLPKNLLVETAAAGGRHALSGSGAGHRKKGNRQGRPLPSRQGRLDGRNRIDLVATLQAAAPWQRLRRQTAHLTGMVAIYPSDIQVKCFEETSDRLLIFTVDASGSSAIARLAEAKGAVELLLAQSYARRDHVALFSFRGNSADLLLPPTRSLVQAKRRLAAMPGSGGTPLATGLRAAGEMALRARRLGLTPALVLLTDGRANVALDGTPGRIAAQRDAETIATWIGAQGCGGVVLDIGNRPHPPLQIIAARLGARYIPLPRADAQRMSTAVEAALES